MKIGLIPINLGFQNVDQMIGLAQHAEAAGIESLWTFEHVIVPLEYESAYPYSSSGKMGATPETGFIDPLIALTAVAGATSKVKLGTGISILSQANPIYLAKQAASLDLLSNGRLLLGLGIGWLKEEFEACGVPFERRGARFDDYIQAMKKVWSGDVVEHQSEFLNWSGFKSYPIPQQKPFPVIIGGSKGKIHQRIAKYGDGWIAPAGDPTEISDHIKKIEAECAKIGRNVSDIEITASWAPAAGKDVLKQLEDVGVSRVTTPLFLLGADPIAGISKLSDEFVT